MAIPSNTLEQKHRVVIPKNIVCVWDNNVCTRRDMYILHGECTYDTYIDETVETIITQ